jgi:YVTN family beta-propeller protein
MLALIVGATAQIVSTVVSTGNSPMGVAVNPATSKVYVANSGGSTVTVYNAATGATNAIAVGISPQGVAVNPLTNRIYVTTKAGVTVIDGSTDSVITTVATGTNPTAVAVNVVTNQVYVANTGDATATAINGANNQPTTIAAVGTGPDAIAINPATGRVYITSSAGLAVIDGGSNAVIATASAGTNPAAVAVNPATNLIYVANSGSGDVTVFDGSSNTSTTDISVSGSPDAVVVNPVTNNIYVANQGGYVSVIAGATNLIASVDTGSQPAAVAVNILTNQIYVANNGGGTVTDLDGGSNSTTTIITGSSPSAIAIDPVTNKVYVASSASGGGLIVIDGAVNAAATFAVGNNPTAAAANPATNKIYIANHADNTVTVFNEVTQGLTTVNVGTAPQEVAVNPVTNQIFVLNVGSSNVTLIDGNSDSVQGTAGAGTNPAAIAVDPMTDRVYVANSGAQSVTVIDGSSGAFVASVSAGNNPDAIAVNPVTNTVYVANGGDDTVMVIDGPTSMVTTTISVGSSPGAIDVNPVTNTIYVANYGDGTVTVIDGSSASAVTTVTVGTNPQAVAVNAATNKIYVANSGGGVTVIDATNSYNPTTVNSGENFVAVAVNAEANKIYALDSGGGVAVVIDGWTNTATPVNVGTSPAAAAVDPVTGNVYFANSGSANVTAITPNAIQTIPLTATIQGVNDAQTIRGNGIFSTSNASPSFTATVTSAFSPNAPPPTALYYQLDTAGAKWAQAIVTSGAGSDSVTYQIGLISVPLGVHTIYAYAAYGNEGTSTSVGGGSGNSPEVGNLTAYLFAILSVPTTTTVNADVNPQSIGSPVNFTALVTPNFGASVPAGIVGFYDGATLLGQSTVDGSGHTTYQTSALSVGSHSITARYRGSASLAESASGVLAEVIAGAPASIVAVSGSGQTAPVNVHFFAPLVVLVQDSNLNPVPNAVVSFSGTGLTFGNSGQATTDGAGQASEVAVATASGGLTATASVSGVNTAATFSLAGIVPPVLAMSFAPSEIALNGTSTLTFSITNSAANTVALAGVGFTNNLPTGLAVASPNGLGGTCNGTATAVAGSQSILLSGASLAANSSCTLTVSVAGEVSSGYTDVSGAVTSSNGSAGNSASADLMVASGMVPSTASLSFGSQAVATTSASQTLTLTNATAETVTIDNVFVAGNFSQTNICGNVAPAQSCSISVTFMPSAVGAVNGSLIINDSVGVQVVLLSGTGVAPGVGIAPSSWNFGSLVVGVPSTAQTITITNTGTSNVSVAAVAASGDFSESDNCASSSPIPPGNSCAAQVTFQPTATGSRSGTLTVTANAGTQAVTLTGTGVAAGVGLSASTLTFGSQVVGTASVAQTVTLTNTGTSDLTVSSFTAEGDFAVTSQNCTPPLTLAQNLSCTLQIVFEPQAVGVRNGAVTISDSVGTHVIALAGTGVAPGVGLSSSTLSFSSQLVGTNSVAQNVTVTNTGTSDLTVTTVTASGDFAASGDCVSAGAMAPNATCMVGVTFSPVASGARTGTVTISDSAGTHIIALSGTGVEPGIGFTPSSLSFGSQVVGTNSVPANIIVTNTGTSNLTISGVTAAGDFAESDTCVSGGALAQSATCTISVTFSPVVTGVRTGSITVEDSLGSQVIALAGTGSAPGVSLSPASLTFGSQTVNTTSSSQAVTLTNDGSSNLIIASVTMSGDFAETDTCTSSSPIAANGICTITLTFTPTGVGTRTGTAIINDGAGTQIISLTGTGAAPGATLSPATLNFGSVTVGNSSQSTTNVNLSAGTSSSLTVTGVNISGDYAFTSQCTSAVSPGGACGLSVTFSPSATGTRTGAALISYTVGTGSGQLVLALTGTGTAPGVGLSPSLLNFGSETVGVTSAAQTVTLSNTGTSSLTITSITASGDFSQTNNCPATITNSGQCTIQVTFTPALAGARTGAITMIDGAGTQAVALSGTGIAAGISLSSSTVSFGNQVVGTTSSAQTVTFSNTGSGPVTVSAVTAAGDFAETNTCGTVNGGSNCAISITFTPSANGARTGSVSIVDSAGTQVIATSGTGTQAGVNVSASSLSYGSQTVGTTSAAQTITLTNNGTSALTVSSSSTSGDFAVSSSNCATLPATVNAGANCQFQVTFIPSTTGTRTGSLILGDGVGTQVVSLNGSGSAPGVSLAPSTLTFGTVTVGTSSQQTANVTLDIATASSMQVTGMSATGDYTIVNNCSSPVSPGGSCSVSVTFLPAATGTRTGTVLINYTVATTSGQLVLALTGTGTAPGVGLSPSSLTFGSQLVGTSSTVQSSTLTNTGTSGLTGITIAPIGDFSQTNNCGNAAAGASCTIYVTFTPSAAGTRTGYMVVTDNAGTQTLSLTGTGTAPGVSVSPTSIGFGGQVVGTTTSASTVTLTNSGSSTLSVSSVTASGDFAISSNSCGSVNSAAHCTFQVTFTPTAAGVRTGTVTVMDSVGTQVVALSGTGNAPGVGLSAGLVDFGSYTVGTASATKTVTLTNTGTSSLTVTSFTASGDYAASSANCATLPTALSVNGTCTLQIIFSPTATGTRPGSVAIADSAGTSVVSLTGVGLAPGASLSPASLSFGSVNVGGSAQSTANLNLDGSATGALTVTSMTISGDYQIVNNCSSAVAPGGACSLSVTFAPTAIGDRSGTVVINYDLGTDIGQLVLPLDGTGLVAEATVAPPALAFGSQLVTTTSAAQTVTVTNNGTALLSISSVTASGDFAMTHNCGSLGASLSCSAQVTFTPTASGTRNGTLTITDELGTQVVALSGTGTAPGVGLTQTNLYFGNQAVGTVSGGQTVTVTNTGNSTLTFTSITAAGDYAETDNCSAPIGLNATCSITVTFDPTEIGTRNGTVTLMGNASTQVIVLTGAGTSNSTGTMSSPELTFGPQQVDTTSASQQLVFTNISGGPMTVNGCTITGDFVIASGCSSPVVLQNLNTLTMQIAFSPTAPGDRVGFLQLSDSLGTQQVALQGTGLQSGINISPVNLNFGNQTTGTNSTPQNVTFTNTGAGNLTVTSLTTTAEYTASSSNCGNLPATISVNAYCTFTIVFGPVVAGTASGTLTIVDDQGTQTVGLNGTGVLPGVQFLPSPLTFGSQTVGTSSAAQITTLTNNGLASLVISSVVATGDYSVTSAGCAIASQFTLAVGASCGLNVTFTPVVSGTRVGALTVEDSDGVQATAMSGNATLPGVSLTTSNLNFGQVIVGASAQMTTNVEVSSSTTGSMQVTSITVSGNYIESDNCTGTGVTVAPGNSCYVAVTFSPVATGSSTGLAIVEYTVGEGSAELVLQMTGTGATPGIALNPPSLSFGTQVINTASSALVTQLSNGGSSGLTVSSITASGDFSETNNCAAVPAGSNCNISVVFTPEAAQTLTGTLTITHDVGTMYAGVVVVPLTGIGTAPGVSLTPASVAFANQTINTTSSASTVTLTNNGTSALHVTSVTVAGDFSQSNTCSTVSANGTCSVSATFTPKASGSRTGTVTIKDDAGTQVIALSGTGTAPGVGLSPSSINFGSQTVNTTSASQLVTVTNNGGSTLTISSYVATGDFAVSSSNCTTVNASAQCTLQITFGPTLLGSRTGSVELTDNAGVQIVSLSGQGTAPGISLSPSTLNFGSVAVGSSSQLSVTILLDAAAGAPMTVNSVTVDGDFAVTNNCRSQVNPGGQCSMVMTFTPAITGGRTGVATITYTLGSATNQLEVALSGTGLAPVMSFTPPSAAFGSQVVGTTSATQVVTLRNTGNSGLTGPLGSGGPVISINGDFAQTNNCSSGLSAGGSCTMTISFSPTATGTRNGIINVSDNLGLQTVALSGSGVAPGVGLSPSTLSFGTQVVGTTSGSQSVTVTNSGSSSLSFTSIAASGDFAQTNTCTSAVSQGGNCGITVTFTPTTTATRNGTVTFIDNAGTQVIALSGIGNAAGVNLTATTQAFGSQVVGTTSASQSVTLTNSGTSSLTISSVTSDSDFAETDNCANHSPLAASGTCSITVTFTPTAGGGQTGSITIVDGAGTQVISLSGTGTEPGVSLSPSSLNFGSAVVNTSSATQNVMLTNTGTSSLSIASITASGDFSETDACISHSPLPPSGTNGNTCTITVTFTPVAAGSRSGALTITDGAGTHFVTLTGTGNAPGVQLSSSTLTFGSQTVDTTSGAQSVTLTNSGTSNLTVGSFTTGGDFAVTSTDCPTLPTSLVVAGVCTLQITFTPAAAGTRTGAVTIADGLGTHVIALTGTGAAPGASLSPSTLTFGSVTVGANSQSTVSVALSSTTSGAMTVTSETVSGDYTLVNNCSSAVNPGSSCSLTVTFAPTTTATRTGTGLVNYTLGGGSGELVLAISGTGTAPGVSLSSSNLSFGSQVVGTSSSSQSVTVRNNGSSILTFTSTTATGDFSQTNGCTTVTSGNTCSIQVTFSPTASGSRSGTVSIVDNAGTQTVALSGTATSPGVTLSPTTYNFGSVVVSSTSASKTFSLTNTGTSVLSITSITASAEFSATTTCGATVAANGGTCNITATFTPAATGARNGTITIVDGAGMHVITLAGTGTAAGVSLTSTSLTFVNQVVTTTSAGQTVTLQNVGTSNLSITSVTASGDFARTTTCSGSIAQSGTCTITVTFTPTAAAGRTGAITILDGVGTQVISLSGTGTAPGVNLSSSSLNFGNQVVSTTSTSQSVTLTNTGTSLLTITSLAASGDFAESDNCTARSPLAASTGNCTITITFTPTATGTRSGAVTINDGVGTQSITLSGVGQAPGVQLSVATLTFGSQVVSTTSASQSVTLINNGTSSLTITSVTASGDFAQTNTCGSPIASNGTCTVMVTFTPTAASVRTGAVTIIDGAGTQAISLNGTGTAPGLSLNPTALNFGSQVLSTISAVQTVTLSNTGSSSLTVSAVSASGDFAQNNTCVSSSPIGANGTCTISVTFSPTATGTRSGTVAVTDSLGTHIVVLSGTGDAPGVGLSSQMLTYGSQTVGTSSGAQTVTLTNSGDSNLAVNNFSTAGDFSVSSPDCPSLPVTLLPNGVCTLQITFSPAAAGSRTGAVNITDSLGNAVIALTGTGAAPGASLSPANLNFGSVVVGSTSQLTDSVTLSSTTAGSLTVTSTTIAGDYSLVNDCSSPVSPGSACSLSITFAPAATGVRTGSVWINYSVGSDTGQLPLVLNGTGTAPSVSLSTSTLSFGSQVVNTSSASQSVNFNNNGTSTLNISGVSAVGDFSQTNNCATVAQGSSCTIQVVFTPAATGTRNGMVTIVDDAGTQVVALSGTGNAPGVTLAPGSVNLGSVTVGNSGPAQNVGVTNTGTSSLAITSITAAGDFSQASSNCTTVAAGSNCSIQVTFSPTAAGTRNGTVALVDNAGTQVVALSGTGTAPGVSLSSSVLTFANQVVGSTSAGQTVTLTNTGTSDLAISGVAASGDFVQTNNCVSDSPIPGNGTCTIATTFTPTAAGGRTGSVTILDGAGTQAIALSGNGIAPVLSLSPASISFGNQTVVTSSSPQSVVLSNDGSSSLLVSDIAVSGDFGQTNNCGTVAAGGNCTLQITFMPSLPGARTGTLTATTTAGVGTVSLSGNGTATGSVVSQSSIVFGSQSLGSMSLSQSLTVTNTGTGALTITSVGTSGDFAQTNNCSTLPAQTYCTVQVIFTPTATGARNGILTIVDSAASHTVVLSGVSFDPTEGLSASNLTFGSQTIGTTSAAQIATFTNNGTSALTVSITVTEDFGVSSADCPSLSALLAPGSTCTLTVTFTPGSAGVRNGELNINDNNGTQLIVLTGTGAVAGVSLSPANLIFGSVTVGTSAESTSNVAVDSSVSNSITVTGVTVSGDFNLAQNLCTAAVSPRTECGLSIAFNPAAAGTRTGTAVISYTLGQDTGQLVLSLSGVGAAPGIGLLPSSIDFGSVTVGTTSQSTANVTVDPSTNGAMTVTGVMISGDFTISNNECGGPVSPAGECGLGITFAPSASGQRTGIAVVAYSVGSGSGQLVLALSGTGASPGVSLAPSSFDFGSVTVGTTSQSVANLIVDPSTSGPITVTSVTISGDFSITQNSCTGAISAGSQCGLSILFTPAASGSRTGTAVVDYAIGAASGQLLLAMSGNGTSPGVGLSPASVNFGSVVVGTTSQQTANVSVDLTTDGSVTVIGVTSSGDFTVASQCNGPVTAGDECGLSMTFAPAATGLRTGTVIVNYLAGTTSGQLVLALSGTGIAAGVALPVPSVNFGTQIINTSSASQSIQVLNNGTSDLTIMSVTADGDFAQTGTCNSGAGSVTVSAGSNCTLQVIFTPSAAGTRNGTITLVDNVGTQAVALTGTGNSPGVRLDFSTLTFVSQGIGTTSAAQTITVTNTGTSDLSISSVTAAGDFAQTNNWPATLAPGASFPLAVTFTPTASGVRNGTITIVDNEGTHVVALNGTGVTPTVALDPAALTFSGQLVGTPSAAQSVTVNNTGTSPLIISSARATGNYSQTNNCATVTPEASCTIQVTFTPIVTGLQNGTITFVANTQTPAIALSGTGVQPSLGLAPAALTFPTTTVTLASAPQTVVISNTGTSALTITSVAASADFNLTNKCPGSLAPGGGCNVTVTFTPAASGLRSGTLTIVSSSGTSPQIMALSGIGADFTLAMANGSSSSAIIAVGGTENYQILLTSLNYLNEVKLICIGAPAAANCNVQPNPVQLTGSNTAQITVSVSTSPASAQVTGKPGSRGTLISMFLWCAVIAGVLTLPRRRTVWKRRFKGATLLFGLAIFLSGLGGCGSPGKSIATPPSTPPATYKLMLVGTGGDGLQRNITLTLTVNP